MILKDVKLEDVLKTLRETFKLPASIAIGNQIRYKYVHHYLPSGTGFCLDAGCGNNPEQRMFPYIKDRGYIPIGLDNDPTWKHPAVVNADMKHTPFPNEHFNAIVSVDSLYLDPYDAFREFWRILKPNGVVVIHAPLPSDKQKHVLKTLMDELRGKQPPRTLVQYEKVHRQWYDFGELKKAGLETRFRRVEEFPSWGFFDNLAYDLVYTAEKLGEEQERLKKISLIAWLVSLLEPLDEPKERFQIGLITRMFK